MNDIYRALLNGIPEESFKIKQVVIGIHWTVVVSRYTGMASTLQAPRPHSKTPRPAAGDFEEQDALQVAKYLLSDNQLEASLGLAAINSMLHSDPERCENINALEVLLRKGKKKKVGVIGHFPFVSRLRRELQDVVVFEKNPQPGDLSDDQMASILPDCEVVGISFLEDVGYLPRVAFFMDTFMHRIGLHGKAIIPFVLGYGCNVPAVMATRIMESPRDRLISSVLATLVPCSARTAIILGLVAFFVGPVAAIGIYLLNIFVIAATGKFLTSRLPESSPGLIMEIPVFRLPTLRTLLMKTWLRLREFIVIAWPILIAGSVILSLISYYHLDHVINSLFTPLTAILGLPAVVGTTLIFGLLRKELSLIMLLQALGTVQVTDVLSTQQIIVFTVFVVFYFPCLATLGVLIKEIGLRWAGYTVLMTTSIAIVLALVVRILFEVGSVIPF